MALSLVLGLGLSSLRQGVGALRGQVYIDFAVMADGAPGAAATGQPTLRELVGDATTAQAVVTSGALTAPASGAGTQTGTYTGWRLPEDIQACYADVSFGDTNDIIGMIAAADVSLAAVIDSSLHCVFSASGVSIQRFSNGVLTTDQTVSYGPVNYNQRYRLGWRIVGSDMYLRLPTGAEVGPYTVAESAARTNHALIFEHFRPVSGAPTSKIFAVSADWFASAAAAGRTNLLTAPTDLTNAAWVKTGFTAPAALQFRETAVTGSHTARQTVAKASSAKRYSWRYRMTPIGRDWVAMQITDDAFSDQALRYGQLSTATFGAQSGSFTDKTWMIYPFGDGSYQVQVDFTSDAGSALNAFITLASGDGGFSYAGDIAKGANMSDILLFERPL